MSTAAVTDEDLLLDLDLRVVPLDQTASQATAPVHPTYVSELSCTCGTGCYACSYTCRRAAHDQNMCL